MSYPKSTGGSRTYNPTPGPPYQTTKAEKPVHCGFCGKSLDIHEKGLFFCGKKCAGLYQRQMSNPDKIVPSE
jgi:hypothetical protein